jgi:hypothetical protein
LATCLPFSQYSPAVGVSSSPKIDSSVDLPQPTARRSTRTRPLYFEMDAAECVRLHFVGVEHLLHAVELDQILIHKILKVR